MKRTRSACATRGFVVLGSSGIHAPPPVLHRSVPLCTAGEGLSAPAGAFVATCSAGAQVFAADEAEMVAEIWPQFPRPFGVGGALPRRGRLDIGRGQMIERDIAAVGPTGQARGLKAHG